MARTASSRALPLTADSACWHWVREYPGLKPDFEQAAITSSHCDTVDGSTGARITASRMHLPIAGERHEGAERFAAQHVAISSAMRGR